MAVIIDIARAAEDLEALVDRVAAGEEIFVAVDGRPVVVMRALVRDETEPETSDA